MRQLKVLGPILAAVVALALVGSASASAATVVCETKTDPCQNPVPVGTKLTATAVNAKLETNWATLTCSSSELAFKVGSASGQAQAAEITDFSMTGCKTWSGGTECTMVTSALPYQGKFTSSAKSPFNGTLDVGYGAGGTPFKWHMYCGQLWNCTFTAAMVLDVTGGGPAHIAAQNEMLERTGLCPKTALWSADWVLSYPAGSSLYLASS